MRFGERLVLLRRLCLLLMPLLCLGAPLHAASPPAAAPAADQPAKVRELLGLLGEAHYRRWFLFGDFDFAKLSADGSWGPIVGTPSATLTEYLFTVNGGYRFVDLPSVKADAMIGTRIFSFGTSLGTSGGLVLPPLSDSASITWADPILAGRVILPFDDGKAPWFASLYGDVGGGPNSDLTWQFFGGLGYNFNKSIAGFAGYRYLEIQHSTGSYSFRINQQGPMLGVVFRF